MSKNYVYGIDFGTTNSSIAVATPDGKAYAIEIDAKAEDPRVMRSVVYISPEGEILFGNDGVNRYLKDVAEGRERKKKLVFTGRYIEIGVFTVSGFAGDKLFPDIIEIEEGGEGRLLQALKTALSVKQYSEFMIFGKKYSLEELIGEYLKNIKKIADGKVGVDVKNVVMGRPVRFVGANDELAESRLRKAAKYAGFEKVEFEYEQIGAAWDYGLQKKKENRSVLIFDFGGGTLDLSVIRFPERKILANVGVPIGGDKLNSDIFEYELTKYFGSESKVGSAGLPMPSYIYETLKNWYLISLLKTESFADTIRKFLADSDDRKAIEALHSMVFENLGFAFYEEIDRVKKVLSSKEDAKIDFQKSAIEIEHRLSRVRFEEIIEYELRAIEAGLDQVLSKAGMGEDEIEVVVTTGGSSLIPVVRQMLQRKFAKAELTSQHAFTSVVMGLALRSREIFG